MTLDRSIKANVGLAKSNITYESRNWMGVLDIFFTPINNRVSFDYLILFKKSFCFLGMFLKGNIYG
ncbi:MAG: hypothetical protein COT39_02730 [Parcubacteria group bacterium CG08_land_8_20_14_0_20_48_21]|nr:MAG: hypothetical protein COT39_02730 [Parcubacteria group bacterium CG08_land_8_20_14_0_20_48_21]